MPVDLTEEISCHLLREIVARGELRSRDDSRIEGDLEEIFEIFVGILEAVKMADAEGRISPSLGATMPFFRLGVSEI